MDIFKYFWAIKCPIFILRTKSCPYNTKIHIQHFTGALSYNTVSSNNACDFQPCWRCVCPLSVLPVRRRWLSWRTSSCSPSSSVCTTSPRWEWWDQAHCKSIHRIKIDVPYLFLDSSPVSHMWSLTPATRNFSWRGSKRSIVWHALFVPVADDYDVTIKKKENNQKRG